MASQLRLRVWRLPLESHLSLLVTMRNIEPAQMLQFGQSRSEERDLAPQIGDFLMGKVIFFVRSARTRSGMAQNHDLIGVTIQRRERA